MWKRRRSPRAPSVTGLGGRWMNAHLRSRMLARRQPNRLVLAVCTGLLIVRGAITEGREAGVAVVPAWAHRHVRAILSMPTNVWKVTRSGFGWLRVEAWRQRVARLLPSRPRAGLPWWVHAVRVSLVALVLYALVYEAPHEGIAYAALTANTIWEITANGDDTNYGGAFDPSQTAGMFTDGAATLATSADPVFTSASYTFVTNDTGAYVFIASGTNWTPGWYRIASVSAGAANLAADASFFEAEQVVAGGQAITSIAAQIGVGTVNGCATVASPTGATWTIDYSRQTTGGNLIAYTDLASAGAGLTVSSAGNPFGKQQVGNAIRVTGGTNFTAGVYVIASVSGGLVATVVGAANITTGAGSNGTGTLGGSMRTPGGACVYRVGSNRFYVKDGAYTTTSASTNVAAGCPSVAEAVFIGYNDTRGDLDDGTTAGRPEITASGISTFTLMANSGSGSTYARNIVFDGAALTSSRGVNAVSTYNCTFKRCTNSATAGTSRHFRTTATTCSTQGVFSAGGYFACVAHDNTITAFSQVSAYFCIADSNTGASTDGFGASTVTIPQWINCVAYGNGRHGFTVTGGTSYGASLVNCIAESNTGTGFNCTGTGAYLLNCAAYSNTAGNFTVSGNYGVQFGSITGTGSFFTNAAGQDFSLNNTAGAGAELRAAGFPGVMPIGGTGYLDIGTLQHADPAASTNAGSVFGALGGLVT